MSCIAALELGVDILATCTLALTGDGYFIRVASSADPYDWPYSDDDEEDDDGPDDGALQEIGDAVVDFWSATKTLFKHIWSSVF